MKNRIKFKKHILLTAAVSLAMTALFVVFAVIEYRVYNANYNEKLGAVIEAVREKYPDVTDAEIAEILSSDKGGADVLLRYGVDPSEDAAALAGEKSLAVLLFISAGLSLAFAVTLTALFVYYDNRRGKEIEGILALIEKINERNYDLGIDSASEDELSILRTEIYKTTVMLREAADNSLKDKLDLKRSLEDISHQIKTPLTSILIMLDDLIDDPDMDPDIRMGFIRDIKRSTSDISFLVQALLKLSRFDANAVKLMKKDTALADIISGAAANVSTLCDLKNVTVTVKDGGGRAFCDRRWQTEALTNILKNSVDHSPCGAAVTISTEENSVYSMVTLSDNGSGIAEEDLPHIFERFYRGKSPGADGVGIGLALAKRIIDEDGGSVSVSSGESGTTFRIKYYKGAE